MLLETLLAVPLPVRETVRLPTGLWQGLRNLLLDGALYERQEVPDATPAGTLARLHRTVKAIDPAGRLFMGAGGLEALEVLELSSPLPDLGELPEAWSRGLADGTLRFNGRFDALEFTLSGRLLTRVRAGEPALRLVLRGVFAGLLPAPPPESDDLPWDPDYEAELLRAMRHPDGPANLRALLLEASERLVEALSEGLSGWTAGPPETLSRVLTLDSLEGLEGLTRGFSRPALRQIVAAGQAFDRVSPAIDEVYRLTGDRRLMVWRGQSGTFETSAEVRIDG